MSEEKEDQTEEIQEEIVVEETAAEESPKGEQRKRRFFTRRNFVIGFGLLAIFLVLIAGLIAVLYRTGYTDNFIKAQFVAKMADFGLVFDADVFQVTISPLELTLKNATFNDKLTGDRLFRIGEGNFGLTIQDLFAWQLSRDIKIDTTDLKDVEAWVLFDENGESNFKNLNLAGPSVVNYSSVKFSLENGLVHFGDATRKIRGNADNIRFFMEPVDYDVPDDEKRYKFDFASSNSNFFYDDKEVKPIGITAEGIADSNGAEITSLKLTSPIAQSNLKERSKIGNHQNMI